MKNKKGRFGLIGILVIILLVIFGLWAISWGVQKVFFDGSTIECMKKIAEKACDIQGREFIFPLTLPLEKEDFIGLNFQCDEIHREFTIEEIERCFD